MSNLSTSDTVLIIIIALALGKNIANSLTFLTSKFFHDEGQS